MKAEDTNVVTLKEFLDRKSRPTPGPGQLALFDVPADAVTAVTTFGDAIDVALDRTAKMNAVEFPTVESLPSDWTYDDYLDLIEDALIGDDVTQQAIAVQGIILTALLISKNKHYGNSALNPVKVFSKASAEERMHVRMDDKLSRLSNGLNSGDGEDALRDLAGYLLLQVVGKQTGALK